MALIAVKNVTIAFDGVTVVEDVSFEIDRGDYLVIVGENGSGKSTLVRAMLGLVRVRSGQIIYGDGLTRAQIGYLPQQTVAQRDFPASVEEVVLSGCTNQLGKRFFFDKRAREKAHDKMHMLGIEPLRFKPYRTLSGGQQQRTLLARALCATDSLLLLDEPVTGLDPETTQEMYQLLHTLNHEHGVSIAMVSHDLKTAMTDATRVLEVNRGVGFFGSIDDYRRYKAGEVSA